MNIEIDREEEENSVTPRFVRAKAHISDDTATSNFTIKIENISEEFLKIWSMLPDVIRLDSSTAFMQKEYEKISINKEDCKESQSLVNKCNSNKKRLICLAQCIKVIMLITCWIMFFIALSVKTEKTEFVQQIALEHDDTRNLTLDNSKWNNRVSVTIEGPLLQNKKNFTHTTDPVYYILVWFELLNLKNVIQNISTTWIIPLHPSHLTEVPSNKKESNVFLLDLPDSLNHHSLLLKLKTNMENAVPIIISYDQFPIDTEKGVIYGAILLLGLYILIIFELINKTIAAVIVSTSSLAVLAILNQRPSMTEILTWIDMDTLLLLFSMMTLVAIVSNTGIFDYLAVYAYKITSGKVWPLVCTLCFSTALISSFLDNVTVILLVTPVTIRLCKVMGLEPVPILTAMVIFSNIGGGMTPVGDPPNVIIASHHDVIDAGIDFGTFTAHMSIGVILVLIVMYGHFSFIFRNLNTLHTDESKNIEDLKNEIIHWKNLTDTLPNNSRDESLVKETVLIRLEQLSNELKKKSCTQMESTMVYKITLKDLQNKYPIKNKWLLIKSGFSMALVLVLFFFHSTPEYNLSLGWTAFLGVLLLTILADSEDFEGIITKVEWSTLMFFAALFVMMEALAKLGLIDWIGKQIEIVVMSVREEHRLAVAILIMLWVSAIIGAFFDNVPLTTMLIRIALGLAENETLKLPLQPLIWALAFGACLGGNGTLIGATANVVCAGVAEQHGHHLTFIQFFKMGFPVLITSNLTVTVYLLVAHVVFSWNS